MRELIKKFWNKIKWGIFLIVWTAGIIGWMYFYQEFKITRAEANQAYEKAIHLREQRIENSVGESVSGRVAAPSTESTAQLVGEGQEPQNLVPSDGIEKIIYEVAKEKQFNDPGVLVRIAKAESSFNPCTKNPNSSAIGIFQILDMHGLSREERCNPRIATAWAIDHFNGGNPWNSSRHKWDI